MIAITTSNSMRVNAEEDFLFIFMWVFFSAWFRLRARLRRTSVLRVAQSVCCFGVRLRFFCGLPAEGFMRRRVFWGFSLVLELTLCSEGPSSELRAYRSLHG